MVKNLLIIDNSLKKKFYTRTWIKQYHTPAYISIEFINFSYECLLLVLDICMSNLAEGAYNKFNYSIYNIQWLLDKSKHQPILIISKMFIV